MELIFKSNPTTDYSWDYDETILDGLFSVKSNYVQDESCPPGGFGCGGAQHFKLIAGQDWGTGTFFACNMHGKEEANYDVMSGRLGSNCLEITIRVQDVVCLCCGDDGFSGCGNSLA